MSTIKEYENENDEFSTDQRSESDVKRIDSLYMQESLPYQVEIYELQIKQLREEMANREESRKEQERVLMREQEIREQKLKEDQDVVSKRLAAQSKIVGELKIEN